MADIRQKQEETPTLATKQRDDAATASRTELFVRLGLMVVVALGAGMFLQPWKSNQDM